MKNQICKKELTKLYSSIQFINPSDNQQFGRWNKECGLSVLVHLLSVYTPNSRPSIYFRAKVSFDVNIIGNQIVKSNFKVKEIRGGKRLQFDR